MTMVVTWTPESRADAVVLLVSPAEFFHDLVTQAQRHRVILLSA